MLACVRCSRPPPSRCRRSRFEPFTVKDIRVEGLQRTEAGTVFSYLPVKVGETHRPTRRRAPALAALFATGFFKDVRLEVDGDVLVVIVEERPAIAAIDFAGMKEFEQGQRCRRRCARSAWPRAASSTRRCSTAPSRS